MKRIGAVGIGLILAGGGAVILALGSAVYASLITRISADEGTINSEQSAIIQDHTDIAQLKTNVEWIRASLEAKGFKPATDK